jgi:hypothetical protein
MNEFDKYMLEHMATKGPYTHTYMAYPFGKYYIPDEELDTFYKKYAETVLTSRKSYSLTERHHKDFGPLIADFDFRYDSKDRQIDDSIIGNIVVSLTGILRTMFTYEADFTCYVLQRPNVYKFKKIYKDGLHLQFPHLVFDYKYHHVVRNIFMDVLKGILSKINLKNDIEDVYDKCVIDRNNWCMYGSTKPNVAPYKVHSVHSAKSIHKNELELVKLLSIQGKKTKTAMNEKRQKEMDEMWEEMNKPKMKPLNELSFDNIIATKMVRTIKSRNYRSNEPPTLEKVEELLKLIPCYNDYKMWLNVGMILHNIDSSSESLSVWDEWSRQSSKYESDECSKKWNTFKDRSSGLTIASLYYYAKNASY